MKLIIFVVFALFACALARPQHDLDLLGHARAAAGFVTGVAAVPIGGLGGGALGLLTGGPKGALAKGAAGAHGGTHLAQIVGGQGSSHHHEHHHEHHNGHHHGHH